MIHLVAGAVVGFLEADYAVETRMRKPLIVFSRERHHLDSEVAEIGTAHLERFLYVVGSGGERILAGHDKQILKRPHGLDGLALGLDLLGCEDYARNLVVAVEAAVYTGVCAGIGYVHRDEYRNRLAEALFGYGAAAARHLLDIRGGRRRNQRHEIGVGQALLGQGTLHVGSRHGLDAGGGFIPVVMFS